MSQPRAADDFAEIKKRVQELTRSAQIKELPGESSQTKDYRKGSALGCSQGIHAPNLQGVCHTCGETVGPSVRPKYDFGAC